MFASVSRCVASFGAERCLLPRRASFRRFRQKRGIWSLRRREAG